MLILFSAVAVVAWLGVLNAQASAALAAVKDEFDCVIEPKQLVKLSSQVEGVIARLDVDRGDWVRKGQVIGKLQDGVEAANLILARARAVNDTILKSYRARYEFLVRKFSRTEQLALRQYAAPASADEDSANAKVAEQQVKEAEFSLYLAQLEAQRDEEIVKQRQLVSPVDGIVVERLLNPGEYRNEQSPILTLAEIDPLRVEVFVPTAFYGQIQAGDTAIVRPEEPVSGSHPARVTIVDNVLDAGSGTFGVRLELPNPKRAIPAGLKCKIRFGEAGLAQ